MAVVERCLGFDFFIKRKSSSLAPHSNAGIIAITTDGYSNFYSKFRRSNIRAARRDVVSHVQPFSTTHGNVVMRCLHRVIYFPCASCHSRDHQSIRMALLVVVGCGVRKSSSAVTDIPVLMTKDTDDVRGCRPKHHHQSHPQSHHQKPRVFCRSLRVFNMTTWETPKWFLGYRLGSTPDRCQEVSHPAVRSTKCSVLRT
jgi:hypothetical protein